MQEQRHCEGIISLGTKCQVYRSIKITAENFPQKYYY